MLSVIFATRDRAERLGAVLESFAALTPPPGGWEMIVVDNGSVDHTCDVLERFREGLPLTVLGEPTPGKNAALNIALDRAGGDLVVLTDDDVFPRPDWLVALKRAADGHADVAVFGGAVLPRWEIDPPPWALEWVPKGPVFTLTDPDLREGPVHPSLVFGPNMAVRSEVVAAGHRFDPTIGPSNGQYAMGSETELLLRLDRAGLAAWYCPEAVVEHFIRREQLDASWAFGRAFRFGRGQYRLAMLDQPTPQDILFGVPRWLLRATASTAVEAGVSALSRNEERRFRSRWQLAFLRGEVEEARQMHRGRPTGGREPSTRPDEARPAPTTGRRSASRPPRV